MNKPLASELLGRPAAFAPYQDNQQLRIDPQAEARAHQGGARVGISQAHESAALHVTGSATYTDDIPELAGTLHCALGLAPVAAGRLLGVDLDALRAMPGVVRVFTAADIPGANDWGSIVHDDPILCDGEIRYLGQPAFAVVAETREQALRAAALAKKVLRVEAAPPVLTPQEAHARGQYVVPPMHLVRSSSGLDEAGIRARIQAAPHRLQQESADAHGRAVAAVEEPAALLQIGRQHVAALDRRPCAHHVGLCVVLDVGERAEVDQKPAVAHAPRGPGVTAGAHRDRPIPRRGQAHAALHVGDGCGQQHGVRLPVGAAAVEDPAHAGLVPIGIGGLHEAAVERRGVRVGVHHQAPRAVRGVRGDIDAPM